MSGRRAGWAVLVAAGLAVNFGSAEQKPWPGDRFDVLEKPIDDLQKAMSNGVISARELVEIYLARIAAYDRQGPALNAMTSLNPRALDEAAALDRERAGGRVRGALHGIPIVVKDNFDVAGLPTSGGSLALASLMPPDDAFQVKKLRAAGAIIIGKTNLHELASGITTISSYGGQTRNPYDLRRNPGGSSGGTGAAIAANFAAAGMGSDTCGSIRIPASHNALVGLRGSFGLSSRDGVLPLSHSQDVAGPLARTITDLAILLDATVGADPADASTTLGDGRRPKSYREALRDDAPRNVRIGLLTSLFGDAPEDNEAGAIVRRAAEQLKKLGAETIDVAVPGLDELLRGSSVIDAEFKFDFADYLKTIPGAPVQSLGDILAGGLHHAALDGTLRRRNAVESRDTEQYRRARVKRDAVKHAVHAAMEEHRLDALAYPTVRRKPALIGEPQAGSTCQLSAASGLPALSVPAGFTNDGLPIAIELLGRAFDEPKLLGLGYALERSGPVRKPPFSTPALTGRGAPGPIAFTSKAGALTVRFGFSTTTGELRYDASVTGLQADAMIGAWIHRGGAGENGPAVHPLLARGEMQRSGVIAVSPIDHARLRAAGFYVALHTRGAALARAQIE